MKITYLFAVFFISGCVSSPIVVDSSVPVMIAPSGSDDLCGGVGIVIGNDRQHYSIHKKPERNAQEVIAVSSGSRLLLCDSVDGWYGVVVLKKGTNCISESVSERQKYMGPCVSGWIEKSVVRFFAG